MAKRNTSGVYVVKAGKAVPVKNYDVRSTQFVTEHHKVVTADATRRIKAALTLASEKTGAFRSRTVLGQTTAPGTTIVKER